MRIDGEIIKYEEPVAVAPSFNVTPVSVKSIGTA
jgi:hypothetical protein